jgi:hypothetical protein
MEQLGSHWTGFREIWYLSANSSFNIILKYYKVNVFVKVKVILEQVTKALRGSSGVALLFP